MKKIILASVVLIIAIIVACSVASKNEMDNDAKVFLNDFQDKLTGPDDGILKLFTTNQSKEELLKAIAILQNKDTSLIKSRIVLSAAKSSWVDTWLVVEIPVELINKGKVWHDKNILSLKLAKRDGRYYIGSMDGNELYKHFWMMKDAIENADAIARRMADIKVYYDKAKELQRDYDSVVWFVHHKNMTYYYVVNGKYNFDSLKMEKHQDFKMGLIDETGKVIVPTEFDLIGNPSMIFEDAVEVRMNGKIGYYTLQGKEIVPTNFDWIVPYEENSIVAITKSDSLFGSLNKNLVYAENFPSKKAEQSIKDLEYLTNNVFTFGDGHQEMINILYPMTEEFHYRGAGLIVYPAYFVKNHILPLVAEEYLISFNNSNKDNQLYEFGNEYVENSNEKPFKISETIRAFISNFKTRYVGGRGEFYTVHQITLIDKNTNVVSSVNTYGDKDFEVRKLSNELFESKFRNEYVMGWNDITEQNFPEYNYFKFDGGSLIPLQSKRRFRFTEFVKIDSSYLSGYFNNWEPNSPSMEPSTFVSKRTLEFMRDEILASYGFVFSDSEKNGKFRDIKKDTYSASSFEEVYGRASEIDKHNLDFLNKLIGSTPGSKSI